MSLDKDFQFTWNDVNTYAIAIAAAMVEEFVKHPIGSVTAVVLLLLTYDKWRTQRIDRKLKEHEYERITKRDGEHHEGSED